MREGRGRSFTFRVETPALLAALHEVARQSSDEFTLLQCRFVEVGGHAESVFEAQPVEQLSVAGAWNYFIQSRIHTAFIPASTPRRAPGWDSVFSANGLVSLQHPDPIARDASDPPQRCIGIVHRVVNVETGEVIEHAAYDAIFAKLKARLRRAAKESPPPLG